jgi:methyltransferase (TIGR00027 family)
MRAVHQVRDESPRILDDPYAMPLLGDTHFQTIDDYFKAYPPEDEAGSRTHVVLRSRYAEDRLAQARARGVSQYVVLGAGLDTFSIRCPRWAQDLFILEVDHAGTQEVKHGLIAAAQLPVASNARFGPVDFEHESLTEGLIRHGIDLAKPTFFSWLGVTMYLPETAVDAVLQQVGKFPRGSEIVLTFAPRGRLETATAERVARIGEPWLTFLEPDELKAKLHGFSFSTVEFLSRPEAETRYPHSLFAALPDDWHPNVCAAVV